MIKIPNYYLIQPINLGSAYLPLDGKPTQVTVREADLRGTDFSYVLEALREDGTSLAQLRVLRPNSKLSHDPSFRVPLPDADVNERMLEIRGVKVDRRYDPTAESVDLLLSYVCGRSQQERMHPFLNTDTKESDFSLSTEDLQRIARDRGFIGLTSRRVRNLSQKWISATLKMRGLENFPPGDYQAMVAKYMALDNFTRFFPLR